MIGNSATTITVDTIRDAMKALERDYPAPPVDPFSLGYFGGMKIIEAPEYPVLKIRDDFKYCTDEFRAEMNLWLLGMFGMRSVVPDNKAYIFGYNVIMNPRSIVAIHNCA